MSEWMNFLPMTSVTPYSPVFLLPSCVFLLCLLCRLIFSCPVRSHQISIIGSFLCILFPWEVLSITFNYHLWQTVLPKASHSYVFISSHIIPLRCNWHSSTKKWGLSSLPLKLGGSLWLPWPMKYAGSDTTGLLRLSHLKNTVSTWLSLRRFLLLEPIHPVVRKPRPHGKATCGCCSQQLGS